MDRGVWQATVHRIAKRQIRLRTKAQNESMLHKELYLMYRGDLNKKEIQKGGDIWMRMVDPFCCAVETNTTL